MSTPRLFVMFDLDGTLVDTSALYLKGVPLVVQRRLGRQIAIDDYMDLWGRDVRTWFARAAGGHEDQAEAMYSDFEAFYRASHARCRTYAGVAEGLAALKQRGHTVGVVTMRPQRRAELVGEFSWSAAIDFVIGGDRVARRKPFPDSLDLAVERYRTPGNSVTVYVGDNALDMEAARASRHDVISVAAMWGCRDRAALLAARPDRVFGTFRDCAGWLTTLS